MLYLIGIGLTAKDISIGSLERLQACSKVYLENYTSQVVEEIAALESLCGVRIEPAPRSLLECTDTIIKEAAHGDVALLVAGSPLFATTHTDLLIRAREHGVPVHTVHNASILNVMGCCGLYSYAFGRTVSIPFFEQSWKPTSFYTNIAKNIAAGLHTLCLLDIRIDETQKRYMTANTALRQLEECEAAEGMHIIGDETEVFIVCRFGCPAERIIFGKIVDLRDRDFGMPLHSLIIPAKMDVIEREHAEALFR
eukprot:jgi/Antlo1/2166/1034